MGVQKPLPVLVTFGELAYRVPINNGIEYWSMLKRQNVPWRQHWTYSIGQSRSAEK